MRIRFHHRPEAHFDQQSRGRQRHRRTGAAPRLRETVCSQGHDLWPGRGLGGGRDRGERRRRLLEVRRRHRARGAQREPACLAGDRPGPRLPDRRPHHLRHRGRGLARGLHRAHPPGRHDVGHPDRRGHQPGQQRRAGLRRAGPLRGRRLLQGCPTHIRQHRVRHPCRGGSLLFAAVRQQGWLHHVALRAIPMAQARKPVVAVGAQSAGWHLWCVADERRPGDGRRSAGGRRADAHRRPLHLRRRPDPAPGQRADPAQILAPKQAHRGTDGVQSLPRGPAGGAGRR
mmetsp:Transcript_149760/g.480939  ORF Transcript_149760/g.480939 Transcript_149760/m.480939 type:complete len:286 (-) Transcript_149760:630-1487(-)